MPIVKVYLRRGKSPEYIRSVGDAIHEALVAQANVPQDDRFQVFLQLEAELLIAHPSYGGVNRSDDLVIIEITLNAGRSIEFMKILYASIPSRRHASVDVRLAAARL